MQSLKQVVDFKIQNNILDLNTYISILAEDLKTCGQYEDLKVFDASQAKFLEKTVVRTDEPLKYHQLEVIQKAALRGSESFKDSGHIYQLTVEQSLNQMERELQEELNENK